MTPVYFLAAIAMLLTYGDRRQFCATCALVALMLGSSWADPDSFGAYWYGALVICEAVTALAVAAIGSRSSIQIAILSAMLAACHIMATGVLDAQEGFDPYPPCVMALQCFELIVMGLMSRRAYAVILTVLRKKFWGGNNAIKRAVAINLRGNDRNRRRLGKNHLGYAVPAYQRG